MGSTGGGVWKTTDYGQSWTNISDGFFETASIGAIEVAESNPDVIYVGTGSAAIRSNVIKGLGVYKSTDAGKTWTHVGLRDVGAIGAVRVASRPTPTSCTSPRSGPVFVDGAAARRLPVARRRQDLGEGPVHQRPHRRLLARRSIPSNPDRMYAAAWRGQRKPWTIISGGPASENGIYTSTDGGNTWTRTSEGLPTDLLGKIDVDVSRANPTRLYAIVEAVGNKAGLYRSDDAGATWTQVEPESVADRAAVLLHVRRRRSEEPRRRLGEQPRALEVHRRRQDVRQTVADAARRQPRHVDQPRRRAT